MNQTLKIPKIPLFPNTYKKHKKKQTSIQHAQTNPVSFLLSFLSFFLLISLIDYTYLSDRQIPKHNFLHVFFIGKLEVYIFVYVSSYTN